MAKTENDPGFQLYDVKIRLSGDRNNEARRFGLTAPAVMLLSMIHGPDSLAECDPVEGKTVARTDREERARLIDEFEGRNPHKHGFVARVFGSPMGGAGRLPRSIPEDFGPDSMVSVQRIPEGSPLDPVAAAMT